MAGIVRGGEREKAADGSLPGRVGKAESSGRGQVQTETGHKWQDWVAWDRQGSTHDGQELRQHQLQNGSAADRQ